MRDDRIGKILVNLGYLSNERLLQAEQTAMTDHQKFGEHLCQLGFIRKDELRHALAVQFEIPGVDLKTIDITSRTLQCLPAELAERYRVLPVARADGQLDLAMTDPFDFAAIDDIGAACGLEINRLFAREGELTDALRKYYGTSAARMADSLTIDAGDAEGLQSEDAIGDLHELVREPSLINLVNLIILEAIQEQASDIHIEPFEHQLKVKYRIDGILHEMAPPPKHLQAAIISRIKIMAQLNIAERFLPQDGHIKFNASDMQVDIRVSTVPTMFGESVVMRILNKTSTLRMLGELGMDDSLLHSFNSILGRPHGIMLVTGPTGSGKTSTLYAALNHIYTPAKKIITIEDPVEFYLEGINQIQVNPKRGLTFAGGLRSILRQDPDIVMVGEIRDGETADIAIRSALTGHMVFSSLHTNDSAGAITRLLDMGIEPFLLATTVEGVVAQRLVRILCDRCAEAYEPSQQVLHQLGADAEMFKGKTLRQAKGCQECHQTGYRGRIGIFEMIRLNDVIREIVMDRPSSNQVRQAVKNEFIDMRHDGYRKVLSGITTLEEVWRVTQDVQQNGSKLVSDVE